MRTKVLIAISGIVFAAEVLGLSAPARADLIPIGPFSGDLSESWEEFPLPHGETDYLSNPTTIMGGAATISNPYMQIYEPGVWHFPLADSGPAQVADGVKGMGVGPAAQTTTITFGEPIASFGAYWGAHTGVFVGDPALINVNFFDVAGDLIGTSVFAYSRPGDGILEWHGWTSSTPITSLTYTEDGVAVDAIQANPVPEPATAMIACLFVMVPGLRRRTRR